MNIIQKENLANKQNSLSRQKRSSERNSLPAAPASWKTHWDLLFALAILIAMLVIEYGFHLELPDIALFPVNILAYLLAGRSVLKMAWKKASKGELFNEFVLMSVATIGAFLIGEYQEGVAVMVFYQIGEWFQDSAVRRAKRSIKALLDIRADQVRVLRNGKAVVEDPKKVEPGEIIQVFPGEKVALDGELTLKKASFNTAALTGESKPDSKYPGDQVLAGMISLQGVVEVKVTRPFKDSKLSRILQMVQEATARKSQTQHFISRFARVYTPLVFLLASAVCVVPYFFLTEYIFREWFYRALVFLVVSCPCALVISIPLGYFGGIGLASRNGILFKGGNYLDVMTRVKTVVMDKTGTLTKGVFKVQQVAPCGMERKELLKIAGALEKNSAHPVARAITQYASEEYSAPRSAHIEEIAGHGLKGTIDGKQVLAGNLALLKKYNICYPAETARVADTLVAIAVDKKYAGYITIADEIKEDAKMAIKALHDLGIKTVMLSGDKQSVVDQVAKALGIGKAHGDLLPEEKVKWVEKLKEKNRQVAFVGDGINDAPVIAVADAGIAMGGLGSDASIETADIVIQNDQPSRIASAIKAGKLTRSIVWQNIILAMTVKIAVLALAAGGLASLWEAVIADVGVALLAILNAVRIQQKNL